MRRIAHVAVRDFVATVGTRGFVIGLLLVPAIITVAVALGPRLFNARNLRVEGQIAIVDPTGRVTPELRAALDPRAMAARRTKEAGRALADAPRSVRRLAEGAAATGTSRGTSASASSRAVQAALGATANLQVVERPPQADLEHSKAWLTEERAETEARRLALVVVHGDAVVRPEGRSTYGTYDLYLPTNASDRAENAIRQSLREAIVGARVRAQNLDPDSIEALVNVARGRSITVTKGGERATVGGFNQILPIAFAVLLMVAVMTGGQQLLTTTVEEKSTRVVEVLLSAVSPLELMAGKILGQMAVSFVVLGLYVAMGMTVLFSFALFGLLDMWLLFYLVVFFLITYLVIGSLMVAVGAAVNEMREAQSLQTPVMLIMMTPWFLWWPITQAPNSVFSTTISFVPPVNAFAMLLRMTSVTPPPWWQVWLSIVIGVASVFAAVWFAAKVFRIGLLMYGKPPNLATLIRWARAA
ncbi:MAG: hypothetical protein GEU99_04670 [Luteitalea sp.]|nr:hypothetical protein [Luteitalea sp.]